MRRIFAIFAALGLSGCAYVQNGVEWIGKSNDSSLRNFARDRQHSTVLRETETRFSNSLTCVGNLIAAKWTNKDTGIFSSDVFAVGVIQDKTGKYSATTGGPLPISGAEMAISSMARIKYLTIAETTDLSASTTLIDPKLISVQVGDKTALDPLRLGVQTATVTRPGVFSLSNFYVAGSITEFSDQKSTVSAGFNLFDFGATYTQRNIDIALDLRLVNSQTGQIVRVSNANGAAKGKPEEIRDLITVNLRNNVRALDINGSYFRVTGDNVLSANLGYNFADPVHYAVREAIDGALAELFGKFYDVDYRSCLEEVPVDGKSRWDLRDEQDEKIIEEETKTGRRIIIRPASNSTNGLRGGMSM